MGYEFRMTLRFQTKAARWMGTLYLPFIETWVAEGKVDFDGKDNMTPFGHGKFEVPKDVSVDYQYIASPAKRAFSSEWIF